jgi:hypothetical protein
MIGLLGGVTYQTVAISTDEAKSLERLYGFTPDEPGIMQHGATRNMLRHAESDGLRMVAWFARFIPPGEDPLKHLVQLTVERGWDIAPEDVEWAADEADDDTEEEESAAE